MKTDITRSTFKREKHYSGVRMQQGRVQLDADWNEQLDIQSYLDQSTRRDVIGLRGTRQDDEGFEIRLQDASLWIGKGHYYVDGILCENEQEIALSEQPDVPVFDLPTEAGYYLAYVDVWQRSITALDDSSIREVALGGPDTTTRTKTVWQVKLLQVEKSAKCSDYDQAWTPPGSANSGKLRAWAKVSEDVEDDCLVPAGAAYRRRENQLYRVEIHAGSEVAGGPTFKWSRDNGSIVFRLELEDGEIKSDVITVSEVGQGRLRALQPGQWVELGDEERALRGEPGVLVELDSVEGGKLTVKSWPGGSPPTLKVNPTVRCWDSPGALSVASGTSPKSLELEDGVQVQFEAGGEYRTGDYWMIPARTALRDVEWPLDGTKEPPEPIFRARHGIHHHYAPLALLELTSGGKWQVACDCRQRFPALTDLISMFYIGGDGQEAMPDPADPTKLVPLEEPLRVGVTNGRWPVKGARIKFEFVGMKGALSGSRNGSDEYVVQDAGGYVIVATDGDGVAQCKWELDGETPTQQVKATLLDDTDKATHLPVYFGANLSLASQVAYDSSGCLNPSHPANVQDALDQLCHNAALYYVGGDGQEAMPGEWLPAPLKVRVANGQWLVKGASVVFSVVEPGEGGLRKVGGRRVNRRKLEVKTDEHGLVACEWQPDEVNPSQQVKASLAGADDLPVHFTANLSRASEVAYTPGPAREPGRLEEEARVVPPELGPEREGERYTVQEALDTLFATKVNRAGDTITGSLAIEEDLTVEGKVGIGTSEPKAELDVVGDVAINGTIVIDNDGKWVGDPTGLVGPNGPSGAPLHFLMGCLEKKMQVYVALHLFYAPRFPSAGFERLLLIAETAQKANIQECFKTPTEFVAQVQRLEEIETELVEGFLGALVQEEVISSGRLQDYKEAIGELRMAIEGFQTHSDDVLGVARSANIVSMYAALLVPLAPAVYPYGDSLSKPLAEQDVRVIEGVGPSYAWKLKAGGVKTVSQLAALALSLVPSGIPAERLSWFRQQATTAMGVEIDVEVFAPLLDLTVGEVLAKGWGRLAGLFEEDEHRNRAKGLFGELITDLGTLQGALDDAFLDYCRLRDLSPLRN